MAHNYTLGQLARRWTPQPPKKWNPALVTDVHALVLHHNCRAGVEFLLRTRYFSNVLWRFFDQDAMIDHIELILVLCLYELQLGHSAILETVLADDNFAAFMYRLFVVTSDLREGANFRLGSLVLKFVTQLVARKTENPKLTLLKSVVFGPYSLTHLDNYKSVIEDHKLSEDLRSIESKLETAEAADRAQLKLQLNWFYTTLVSSTKVDTSKSENSGEFIRSLLYLIYACEEQNMLSVKILIEYFDIATLISDQAFIKPSAEFSLMSHVLAWDEKTFYDVSEDSTKSSLLSLFPCSFSHIAQNYDDLDDYTTKQEVDIAWRFKLELYRHMVEVFRRLDITVDRNHQLNVKGRSKYFAKIESISFEDDRFKITLPYSEDNSMNCDFIVVLALGNPNKFSSKDREKKYGLELARVAKPFWTDRRGSKLTLTISGFEVASDDKERFNYILRVPKTVVSNLVKGNARFESQKLLQTQLHDTLVHRSVTVSELSLGIENLQVNLGGGSYSSKHKKIKSDQEDHVVPEITDNNVIINSFEDKVVHSPLNIEQKKALLHALQNKLTLIETPPHSGAKVLLNAFLTSLDKNFENERTLVVFPNEQQLESAELRESLAAITCKVFDESHTELWEDYYKLLQDRLLPVSELIEILGLENKFTQMDHDIAMGFYEVEVKPRWKKYLQALKTQAANISDYPFGLTSLPEIEDDAIEAIAQHYQSIVHNFETIEELASAIYLSRPPQKLNEYVASFYFKNVFASQEALIENRYCLLTNYYDNVVFIGAESIEASCFFKPLVNNPKLRRLVLFGDPQGPSNQDNLFMSLRAHDCPARHLKQSYVESDCYKIYQESYPMLEINSSMHESPLLEHSSFHVVMGQRKEKVDVDQGEFVVKLASVVATVIGDAKSVTIVCMSQFQKALIEEIVYAEFKKDGPITTTSPNIASNDYILVSLHDYSSYNELLECSKRARKGLMFVGNSGELTGIPSGELKLKLDNKKTFIVHGIDDLESYLDKIHRKKQKGR